MGRIRAKYRVPARSSACTPRPGLTNFRRSCFNLRSQRPRAKRMPTSRHLRPPLPQPVSVGADSKQRADDRVRLLATTTARPASRMARNWCSSSIAAEFGGAFTDTLDAATYRSVSFYDPVSRPYRSPMWSPSAASRSRRTRFASSSRPPTLPPWAARLVRAALRRHRERSRRVECRGQRLRTLGWADFVRHHDHLVCGRQRVHLRALQRLLTSIPSRSMNSPMYWVSAPVIHGMPRSPRPDSPAP